MKPQDLPSTTKVLERIATASGRYSHEVFRAFVYLAACAASAGRREADYLEEAKRWQPEHMQEFAVALGALISEMQERPFTDVLGPVHMEWSSRSDAAHRGEFYTPMDICRVMAQLTVKDIPDDRPLDVEEAACGSGAMVLSIAEALVDRGYSPLNMRAVCTDISSLACDMCYVNLTLWGIPATVIHGNALTTETWATRVNPFWGLAQAPRRSAITEIVSNISALLDSLTPTKATNGQMCFDFGGAA